MTLTREFREDPSEEMTFEQEPEGGEGAGHGEWGNSAPNRGISKCNDPESKTY